MDLANYGTHRSFQFFCGIGMTSEGHEERIIGGTVPPEGKYPSMVRVSSIQRDGSLRTHCAGSILNRDWILTGAFCFVTRRNNYRNVSRIRVIAGDTIVNEAEPYEQTLRIERFIIHEKVMAQK